MSALEEMRLSLEAARERDREKAEAAAKHEPIVVPVKPYGAFQVKCACGRFESRPYMSKPDARREHTTHAMQFSGIFA